MEGIGLKNEAIGISHIENIINELQENTTGTLCVCVCVCRSVRVFVRLDLMTFNMPCNQFAQSIVVEFSYQSRKSISFHTHTTFFFFLCCCFEMKSIESLINGDDFSSLFFIDYTLSAQLF